MYRLDYLRLKKINRPLRPLFWKTDEAGRFLFFISQKTDEATFFFLFFFSLKTNEAPFLFILSTCIKMLIFWFLHTNKINEAIFFLFKSEKKTDRGIWNRWGRAWETIYFFIWPFASFFPLSDLQIRMCYRKLFFLISQPKYMLWVLKRTVSTSTQNTCLNW